MNARRLIITLILLLLLTSCAPATVSTLRSCAAAHGMEIGSAVAAELLQNDPAYARILSREFSMLTPENALKFDSVHPDRNTYDFSDADAIIAFAESHGMKTRGHTLVWHEQLPSWLIEGRWTRDELIAILREHITTVVGRYRGRVAAWDVLSEAIDDDGSHRDTFWLRGLGPDYMELAFQWAHEADPAALLFYNDYGGEGAGPKADAIYALARGLVQKGVPIHGVGLEMHVGQDWHPAPAEVAANMQRLADLGLQAHITEIDVKIRNPATERDLVAQARIYRKMLEVCLSADNCKSFTFWGFTDRYSWIPEFFPGWDSALIFDRSYRPKPAYREILNSLRKNPTKRITSGTKN